MRIKATISRGSVAFLLICSKASMNTSIPLFLNSLRPLMATKKGFSSKVLPVTFSATSQSFSEARLCRSK